jgi:hypothetical protein
VCQLLVQVINISCQFFLWPIQAFAIKMKTNLASKTHPFPTALLSIRLTKALSVFQFGMETTSHARQLKSFQHILSNFLYMIQFYPQLQICPLVVLKNGRLKQEHAHSLALNGRSIKISHIFQQSSGKSSQARASSVETWCFLECRSATHTAFNPLNPKFI